MKIEWKIKMAACLSKVVAFCPGLGLSFAERETPNARKWTPRGNHLSLI